MKIGFITNVRAPYRTLQLREFSKIDDTVLNVYYTNKKEDNRDWEIIEAKDFNEMDLKGFRISDKYGYINIGLLNIILNNDLIILGGYEQPTYIILSLLCRVMRKKYILVFDGISYDKIEKINHPVKMFLKRIVINNSYAIMGNGKVSRKYFEKNFKYPPRKIYNQYLTVDMTKINSLYTDRLYYRNKIREKYNMNEEDKVLIYSGRLIDIKNVEMIIRAIKKVNKSNLKLLVIGNGELYDELLKLSMELNVDCIFSGFMQKQEELFKHYFAGDCLILPSKDEAWGLVVNEAMAAGLPVIVSEICGCSKDLVIPNQNGYRINPYDLDDIAKKIEKILFYKNLDKMGEESKKIIKEWSFSNSKMELEKIIKSLKSS